MTIESLKFANRFKNLAILCLISIFIISCAHKTETTTYSLEPTWVNNPQEGLDNDNEDKIVIVVITETDSKNDDINNQIAKQQVSIKISEILYNNSEDIIKNSTACKKEPKIVTASSVKYFNSLVQSHIVKKITKVNTWIGQKEVASRFVINLAETKADFQHTGSKYKSFISKKLTDEDVFQLTDSLIQLLQPLSKNNIIIKSKSESDYDDFYDGMEEKKDI